MISLWCLVSRSSRRLRVRTHCGSHRVIGEARVLHYNRITLPSINISLPLGYNSLTEVLERAELSFSCTLRESPTASSLERVSQPSRPWSSWGLQATDMPDQQWQRPLHLLLYSHILGRQTGSHCACIVPTFDYCMLIQSHSSSSWVKYRNHFFLLRISTKSRKPERDYLPHMTRVGPKLETTFARLLDKSS